MCFDDSSSNMKLTLVIIIVCCFACLCDANRTKRAATMNRCSDSLIMACSDIRPSEIHHCNASYGGIQAINSEIYSFVNLLLSTSYEYLLIATHFNSHQANRPGFYNLYMDLSERTFFEALQVMVRNARRSGGDADFNERHLMAMDKKRFLPDNEIHSLGYALDMEKQIYENGLHVHNMAMHGHPEIRDPEWSALLQNQIMDGHGRLVRTLTGYITELHSMLKTQEPSVCLYVFDRFLQAQVKKPQDDTQALGDIQAYSIDFWGITINFCISFAVNYCKEFHPFGLTINLCVDFAVKYCT